MSTCQLNEINYNATVSHLQKLSRVLLGLLIVVAPPLGAFSVVDDHAFDDALLPTRLVPHYHRAATFLKKDNWSSYVRMISKK